MMDLRVRTRRPRRSPRGIRRPSRAATATIASIAAFAASGLAGPRARADASSEAETDLEVAVAELRRRALAGSGAYEIVESLTTEVGPRLAGTPAEARARSWAVAMLERLGFERVRVEPAVVRGWKRGRERARVVAPFPQPLRVTALGHSVSTPKAGLRAPVVRFADLDAVRATEPGALDGRIAFIDRAMPRTQDGSGYGAVVEIRSAGPSVAATKGAEALLIRSVGTDHHRLPHTGMLRYRDDAPSIPAAALSVPDADQLGRILARGDEVLVHLELHPRFTGPEKTGNVVAEVRGAARPDEIVLVGAHLDSWDLGTGAVDDGAGVAIVVAAARLVKELGRPERTVRVVLFGAEEVGLVGAKAYAEAHAEELEKHVVAAESDFGAGPIYRLSAHVPDAAWPAVEQLQRLLVPLQVVLGDNRRHGGPDLIPLRRAGVPLIAPEQDGRDYFDVHHTADDTLDKIEPRHLDQNVAVYASWMWAVANAQVEFREDAGE